MQVRVASAPCSWGVLMKDTPNVPPYSQVLDEIEEAGYKGTELGPYGYLPFEVSKLRDDLERRGLTLTSAFTIFNFLEAEKDEGTYREAMETVQVLSALGCKHLVLSDVLFEVKNRAQRAGRIREEDSLSGSQWDTAARNVDAFARMVYEEHGMKCVAHPHVGGYLETDFEIDALLERTDPELVGMCFDMAHIAYGGGDPVAVLDKWRERTWYLHIKECDTNVREQVIERGGDYYDGVESGVFPELGKGTIDWQSINRILHEIEFDSWGTVEQDIMPAMGIDALGSAKNNRAFLRDELDW